MEAEDGLVSRIRVHREVAAELVADLTADVQTQVGGEGGPITRFHNLEHALALHLSEQLTFEGDLEMEATLDIRLLGPAMDLNLCVLVGQTQRLPDNILQHKEGALVICNQLSRQVG